jgi:hypothetical protein
LVAFVLDGALIQKVFEDETMLLNVSLLQLHLNLQDNSFDFNVGADAVKLSSSGVHFVLLLILNFKFINIKGDLNIIDEVIDD